MSNYLILLILALVLLFVPIMIVMSHSYRHNSEDFLTEEQTLGWEKKCARCDITGNSNNGAVWANDPDGPNGESGLGWVL
jgi:hypothetical protein